MKQTGPEVGFRVSDRPGSTKLFRNTRLPADNPWQLPRPAAVVVVGLGQEGMLQAVSNFGCISTYPLPAIVVLQNIRLYIPNAFTPNGDGLNDFFSLNSRLVTQLNIQMFDRWGGLLYASDNINFEWAGTDTQGAELPEGVYTYLVRAIGYDGKEIIRTGTVTLIR